MSWGVRRGWGRWDLIMTREVFSLSSLVAVPKSLSIKLDIHDVRPLFLENHEALLKGPPRCKTRLWKLTSDVKHRKQWSQHNKTKTKKVLNKEKSYGFFHRGKSFLKCNFTSNIIQWNPALRLPRILQPFFLSAWQKPPYIFLQKKNPR